MLRLHSRILPLLGLSLLGVVFIVAFTSVAAGGDTSPGREFSRCEECVANGFGWSWGKHLCGEEFLNTNCNPAVADEYEDEDEEEGEVAVSRAMNPLCNRTQPHLN